MEQTPAKKPWVQQRELQYYVVLGARRSWGLPFASDANGSDNQRSPATLWCMGAPARLLDYSQSMTENREYGAWATILFAIDG